MRHLQVSDRFLLEGEWRRDRTYKIVENDSRSRADVTSLRATEGKLPRDEYRKAGFVDNSDMIPRVRQRSIQIEIFYRNMRTYVGENVGEKADRYAIVNRSLNIVRRA